MDFDSDGILDMISGSYDPGDIYLFRGLGQGQYATGESLKDSSGLPLVHHPIELARYLKGKDDQKSDRNESLQDRVASFGSWPEVVDWDGDEDLDLLIGTFGGEVYLRVNQGTRAAPSFHSESVPVEGADGPIKVNGHAHPVVADWDRDGLWDLIIGSDLGSVIWLKNKGTPGEPKFTEEQVLISPVAEQKFVEQVLGPDDSPRQGVRAQVCVCDYNGDGWLDLIVGDYSDIKWTKELSEAELQAKAADESEAKKMGQELKDLGYEDDVLEQRQALLDKLFELDDDMKKKYFREARSASFVWLYLRQPPDSKGESAAPSTSAESADDAAGAADRPNAEPQGPVLFLARMERDKLQPELGTLVVEARIQKDWKLPASGSSEDQSGIPVSITLELPQGWHWQGDWKRPKGEPSLTNSGERYLKRRAVWKRKLGLPKDIPPGQVLSAEIEFQVCNEQMCLPPESIKIGVSLDHSSDK